MPKKRVYELVNFKLTTYKNRLSSIEPFHEEQTSMVAFRSASRIHKPLSALLVHVLNTIILQTVYVAVQGQGAF